jgi:hypothetical protein
MVINQNSRGAYRDAGRRGKAVLPGGMTACPTYSICSDRQTDTSCLSGASSGRERPVDGRRAREPPTGSRIAKLSRIIKEDRAMFEDQAIGAPRGSRDIDPKISFAAEQALAAWPESAD